MTYIPNSIEARDVASLVRRDAVVSAYLLKHTRTKPLYPHRLPLSALVAGL